MLAMLAEVQGEDRGGVGDGRPSGWAPGREDMCGRAWARTRCVGLPGLGRSPIVRYVASPLTSWMWPALRELLHSAR